MAIPDRLEQLKLQNQVTGIDFVYVQPNQKILDIYFHDPQPSALAAPLPGTIAADKILIYSPSGGETHATVPVNQVVWLVISGRDVMRLLCAFPGDFSLYRLKVTDEPLKRVDRFYNDVLFSFKANCPSDLDCESAPHECAPDDVVDFPVDYTARDFWSIRQALLDFASQRYPNWQDRLEADVGVMLAETMAAMGDEFHYGRDRVTREGYLETATQRGSVQRHAALVDYHVHDGLGAATWVDVQAAAAGNISAGTLVTDSGPTPRAFFEIGRGMTESFALAPGAPKPYPVNPLNNSFNAYQWNEDDVCLPRGSVETFVQGNHQASLSFDDLPAGAQPGKWMLLRVIPLTADLPERNWIVRVIEVEDLFDPVFALPLTRIKWEKNQATPFELDLARLQVHANILPATSGQTQPPARFTIGPALLAPGDPDFAIERNGTDRLVDNLDGSGSEWENSVAYLFTLPGTEESKVVYLGTAPDVAAPEVRLYEVVKAGPNFIPAPGGAWEWRRELLGTNSAQPESRVFRLDNATWKRVAGYRRLGGDFVQIDYAGDDGKTIRFGDGEFGMIPAAGTFFETVVRLGGGAIFERFPRNLDQVRASYGREHFKSFARR